jgi:hypothetical protein
VTIFWLYAFALLGSAALRGVMHWLWGDRSAFTAGAEAVRFVRDVAEASQGPAVVRSRACELVAKLDAVQGGMPAV